MTEKEKVKIRFVGLNESLVIIPPYQGRIKPNDDIYIFKDLYEKELKKHKDWELVSEKKKVSKDKGE